MSAVIRIIERADGVRDVTCEGRFLREYTPDGYEGRGRVTFTIDVHQARLFRDLHEAMECWRSVSRTHPLRRDGKPNRPLTIYTCEMLTIEVQPV
jgi:hypothetical protein